MSCPGSEWTHDSLSSRTLPVTLSTGHRGTFPASPPWPSWSPSAKWVQHPITCNVNKKESAAMTNVLEEVGHLLKTVDSELEDDTVKIINDNPEFNISFDCEVSLNL
ncbi:Hypothetical predicted protein [Lynx pardinus]|uniref:Uncharacterized protein n=1 Tax=Lynx pardinus TaxID=191816 RepID=A0A485PJU8_LYNPA|nr:Hypothetical predicted protein [Lynx pardinus]